MTSERPEALPQTTSQSASTLVNQQDNLSGDSAHVSDAPSTTSESGTEEQALESHEVIELQTFSERKAWIEEKIKFLENLPPIEVFVGLDAIRSSAEEVPGLPTRAELQQFLDEHDKIEKETEIFDSGELKKLRMFTKAATQRHLSPEDTDLIELTLTTIYELDKLLHLLRDRSESLDLLGTRLTWEERRVGAWVDRRNILADLQSFLVTRARWSPSVYEVKAKPEEPPSSRRGSISSMTSIASVNSTVSTSSPAFSRSARFKLAELLSRDAAHFAGRVSSLRHSKISAAGKALDKLIDNSRKPVPEELLDEQDRLEEKGINEMETIGKFAMNLVMQWRKADEIYVETMKDQVAAQNLLEEIETAKLQHPTSRQSIAFASHADVLLKRLLLRGNPIASSSTFPRPVHPLFPGQPSSNEALAQSLSSEIATAMELVKKVDSAAKEYRINFEIVKDVEALSQTAQALSATFTSVHERLTNGVPASDGDGSPPDLTSKACLDPTRHSAFLTLLPDILKEADTANEKTTPLLRAYRTAVLKLDRPGIDTSFKSNAISDINHLGQQRDAAQKVQNDVVARVSRLRDARKIWDTMEDALASLEETKREVGDAMERKRWRQQAAQSGTPLTPESPISVFPSPTISSADVLKRLDGMQMKLSRDASIPLSSLSGSLEMPLNDWLSQSFTGLTTFLDSLKQMSRLLEAIQHQASVMGAVQQEVEDFQIQIEELKIRFDTSLQNILGNECADAELAGAAVLITDTKELRGTVQSFMDSLSQRVPFVAQRDLPSQLRSNFVRKRFASVDVKLGASPQNAVIELPFDLTSLDDAVRTDSNSYVMRLAGELRGLDTKKDHFRLAQLAKEVDTALAVTVDDIHGVTRELSSLKASLTTVSQSSTEAGNINEPLQVLLQKVDDFSQAYRSRISRSFSPIRDLLRRMDAAPGCHDLAVHEPLYLTRMRAVDDAELKLNACNSDVASLKAQILEAQRAETQRLEAQRLEKERLERERLEEERLERERLKERLQKERLEQERLAQEQLEQERIERERLEQERLDNERLERKRMDRERIAEEARLQAERKRLEEENGVLERERLKAEESARLRKLEEEREYAERQMVEQERLEGDARQVAAAISGEGEAEIDSLRRSNADDDVPGLSATLSTGQATSQASSDLKARVLQLKRRLHSISINEIASSSLTDHLPSVDQRRRVDSLFSSVVADVTRLPLSSDDSTVNAELRSLRTELETSSELMQRMRNLSDLSVAVHLCDTALSDLLEHVDSYPSPPFGSLSSSHVTEVRLPPEEQLEARLSFTRSAIANMTTKFDSVANDSRAIAEKKRLDQTWSELEDMGKDLISGKKSRPSSVISSGRNSRASLGSSRSSTKNTDSDKRRGYSNLSVRSSARGPATRDRFLSPAYPSPRRVVSGTSDTRSRSTSRLSTVSSSNRSVSGPMSLASANPVTSTFASRQRTSSMSSTSTFVTPVKHAIGTHSHTRAQTSQTKRIASPTFSDVSSLSHTHSRSFSLSNSRSQATPSRSTSSMSTWARAPRQSFPVPAIPTPPRKPPPKKTYVANPKNKLDVAVGDVVNKLPVNINVAIVPETWKDQSGKYWIGDQDPKLCFCRILRSRTVMVRVGGGWTELSKFIKDHFADLFRLMPTDSPPRPGAQEEKWISSTSLLETPETPDAPPEPPHTPEPKGPFLPSFSLSTPSGQSPRSLRSTSSSGSPLTPLQFMRRAEQDNPGLRPISPSKPPMLRARNTAINTPSRNTVWRP